MNNIWITKICLKNFQKHADLTIEFKEGINILHGETSAGKSCIRRAIEWVTENKKFSEKTIRKTGTKETSVQIFFSNSTWVQRVRSASKNQYILNQNGLTQIFDAVNKSIPEEVKTAMTISPIEIDGEEIFLNSTLQISLPFLFDKSPSERMKLFNKLTGNDLLDKLFVSLNKDILRSNKELKEIKISLEAQVASIEEKEINKEKLEAKYKKMRTEIEELEKLVLQCKTLSELLQTQQDIENNLNKINGLILSIKIPEDIDIKEVASKIEVLLGLKSLQDALEQTEIVDRISAQLNEINVPELNLTEESDQISRLDKLKELCYTYDEQLAQTEAVEFKLKGAEKDLQTLETEFKNVLKEVGLCPLCFSEMTEEHIKDLKI